VIRGFYNRIEFAVQVCVCVGGGGGGEHHGSNSNQLRTYNVDRS